MKGQTVQAGRNFNSLYTSISRSLARALSEASELAIDHREGREKVDGTIGRLGSKQSRFDEELSLLRKNAEWEKFTIVFFGETGAGKSTVIESLRILFGEASREQLIRENSRRLKKMHRALTRQLERSPVALDPSDGRYADEFARLRSGDLSPADATPGLSRLLRDTDPKLGPLLDEYRLYRDTCRRVDGLTIGTGEEDFTKGNLPYLLRYRGRVFQLIDVPGIEGNESRYADLVKEAVAMAHLVMYLNGTNKKPEKATARKIAGYLRRGTQVCPIINVKGSADAYEFEEDRLGLRGKAVESALKQTIGVLENALGSDVLMDGHCVQGLLGFSSLACQPAGGATSIHPDRDEDLVLQQRCYLDCFGSTEAMLEFSQLNTVAQVLRSRIGTFGEDIVESNKTKVRKLLTETIVELEQELVEYDAFLEKMNSEFDKCRESLKEAVKTFERFALLGRRRVWNDFYSRVVDKADDVVAEHLGDNAEIVRQVQGIFRQEQKQLRKAMEIDLNQRIADLYDAAQNAMQRLFEDVSNAQLVRWSTSGDRDRQNTFGPTEIDSSLGLKDMGLAVLGIGSYVATGSGIGALLGIGVFSVPASVIGGIVGGAIGIAMAAVNFFMGKARRIRKVQAKLQAKIGEMHSETLAGVKGQVVSLTGVVRKEFDEITLTRVDRLHEDLTRPKNILTQQITTLEFLKDALEQMPYGTIRAIRC